MTNRFIYENRIEEITASLKEDHGRGLDPVSLGNYTEVLTTVRWAPRPRIGAGEDGELGVVWNVDFSDDTLGLFTMDFHADGRVGCATSLTGSEGYGRYWSETMSVESACHLLDFLVKLRFVSAPKLPG